MSETLSVRPSDPESDDRTRSITRKARAAELLVALLLRPLWLLEAFFVSLFFSIFVGKPVAAWSTDDGRTAAHGFWFTEDDGRVLAELLELAVNQRPLSLWMYPVMLRGLGRLVVAIVGLAAAVVAVLVIRGSAA